MLIIDDEFVQKYKNSIVKIISRYITDGSNPLESDEYQTVLFKLLKVSHLYNESKGSVNIFVCTVAFTSVIDFYRRNRLINKHKILYKERIRNGFSYEEETPEFETKELYDYVVHMIPNDTQSQKVTANMLHDRFRGEKLKDIAKNIIVQAIGVEVASM